MSLSFISFIGVNLFPLKTINKNKAIDCALNGLLKNKFIVIAMYNFQ